MVRLPTLLIPTSQHSSIKASAAGLPRSWVRGQKKRPDLPRMKNPAPRSEQVAGMAGLRRRLERIVGVVYFIMSSPASHRIRSTGIPSQSQQVLCRSSPSQVRATGAVSATTATAYSRPLGSRRPHHLKRPSDIVSRKIYPPVSPIQRLALADVFRVFLQGRMALALLISSLPAVVVKSIASRRGVGPIMRLLLMLGGGHGKASL